MSTASDRLSIRASRDIFQGYAGGSSGLANQIKGYPRQGDELVNDSRMGAPNGDWESQSITFAQSLLVIGHNSSSKFAAELKTKRWFEVWHEPNIRIGLTNPQLDTVTILHRAPNPEGAHNLVAFLLGSDGQNVTKVTRPSCTTMTSARPLRTPLSSPDNRQDQFTLLSLLLSGGAMLVMH